VKLQTSKTENNSPKALASEDKPEKWEEDFTAKLSQAPTALS
jgi:hypothetical protein